MARRLLERGVRCVQLFHQVDQHGGLPGGIRRQCKETDQASAALVQDQGLRAARRHAGGLGRRVRPDQLLTGQADQQQLRPRPPPALLLDVDGRQRPAAWLLHGQTCELGYNIVEDPVHVHDLHATLLHLLGVDHERLTYFYQGRDFRLTEGTACGPAAAGVTAGAGGSPRLASASPRRDPDRMSAPLHHAIDYIEITVTDMVTAQSFYSRAFGWKFTSTATPTPASRAPIVRSRAAAGRAGDARRPAGRVAPQDLDATLQAVESCGGSRRRRSRSLAVGASTSPIPAATSPRSGPSDQRARSLRADEADGVGDHVAVGAVVADGHRATPARWSRPRWWNTPSAGRLRWSTV